MAGKYMYRAKSFASSMFASGTYNGVGAAPAPSGFRIFLKGGIARNAALTGNAQRNAGLEGGAQRNISLDGETGTNQ